MGYTHYWRRSKRLNKSAFAAWTQDIQRILDNAPAEAINDYGPNTLELDEETTITDTLVYFNGKGESGHETFYITQCYEPEDWERPENGKYFAFCKTARKPYDLLVTASLIRLKWHFPEVIISSDGDPKDWMWGLTLCTTVFGNAQLPFDE